MTQLLAVTLPARTSSDILRRMVGLVRRTAEDVAAWALVPLDEFFRMVSRGHYNREPDNWRAQVLARPAATISKTVPVIACANKAIIVASWAQMNGIPWRLVAVSRARGRSPHHVFPELYIGGEWRPVDATYPWSVLFARKFYPVRIVETGLEAPA